MKDEIKINDNITSARQPTEEEIRKLPQKGFKSVINLRTAGEEDQPLSPKAEEELVRKAGMEYTNIPISTKEVPKPEQIELVRKALDCMAKPIYVHCHRGKRSGALTMIDQALKRGMTGEEALQKAQSMGFECDVPHLKDFFVNYINQHTTAGKA
ncbi:MAG: phosphatase [wastewater metagenome]|nr:phosphatase [Candidatus Loosdrechtia aerotolerans]